MSQMQDYRHSNTITSDLGQSRMKSLAAKHPELLSAKAFRHELEKEMLRSDRTLSPLTLLTLDFDHRESKKNEREGDVKNLLAVICHCTRTSDSKGWFRDGSGLRIGVILHDTVPDKAERVIDGIRRRFHETSPRRNSHSPELKCEVFTYPNLRDPHKDDDGNGNGNGNGNSHNGNGRNGHSKRAQPIPMEPKNEVEVSTNGAHAKAETNGASHHHVSSIKALLAEPLPLWKRGMDVFGSLVGLVVLSPLLLLIAALIKLTSPGPVLFKQVRVGYLGRHFMCWKFRSMRTDADPTRHKKYLHSLIESSEEGSGQSDEKPMEKLDKINPEITFIGKLLRKSSLDELPQLVNVLRGDMTLVGPRPCLPYEAEHYLRWHDSRFDSMPGITGLWQVMGKNRTTFKQMIRLDINYMRQRTLWLDIKILFMTIPTVLAELKDGIFPNRTIESNRVHQS